MARRSRAREIALQLLYEADRNPVAPEDHNRAFAASRLRAPDLQQFALELVAGFQSHRERIDAIIQAVAQNWSLSRMTPVDRSILRLATYEIVFRGDTPPRVAIDEAIELAKRFGTLESSRFVNGILDRIVTQHPRPEPDPPNSPIQDPGSTEQ